MKSMSGTELLFLIAGTAALLIWGARMTRTGMARAFSGSIRAALMAGTASRFGALAMGIASAMVLQSSTAVGLIAASFASAGAVGVAGGLAIMLGADIGSAIVVQILALDIHKYWPGIFLVGIILHASFDKQNRLFKQLGRVLMGLGCVFLALQTLSSAAAIVSASSVLHGIIGALAHEPVIGFILAALLTWLVHSSLAVLLLLVVLTNNGLFSNEQLAFYLVLGINAGAGIPAAVLTIAERSAARQILFGNLLFRLIGASLAALTISYWSPLLTNLTANPGQQLILIHLLFNSLLAVVFIGWLNTAETMLSRLIVDPNEEYDPEAPRFLDPLAKQVPGLALSAASRETIRMVGKVEQMLQKSIEALETGDRQLCTTTRKLDDGVDRLYQDIKLYLTDVIHEEIDEEEGSRAFEILSFTVNLEHAGDVIERSLLDTIRQKIQSGQEFSEQGFSELMDAYKYVSETIHLASKVFMEKQLNDAQTLIRRKEQFRDIELVSTTKHLERLHERLPNSVATTSYHIDIMRDLKRINSLFASCGYPLLEAAGRLKDSRLA